MNITNHCSVFPIFYVNGYLSRAQAAGGFVLASLKQPSGNTKILSQ